MLKHTKKLSCNSQPCINYYYFQFLQKLSFYAYGVLWVRCSRRGNVFRTFVPMGKRILSECILLVLMNFCVIWMKSDVSNFSHFM
jgi:hypothetical protein